MSQQNVSDGYGYGYVDDESQISTGTPGVFGLNAGAAFLAKYEYTLNGGANGAPGEALDIVVVINGKEHGLRKFPITKAFLPNNQGETTDPNHQAFKDAMKNQNAAIMHILHRFVNKDTLIQYLSQPGMTFQQFCELTRQLLPENFTQYPLDAFLEYQWQFSGTNTRTFLQIPKKMTSGIWLHNAVQALNADGTPGTWVAVVKDNPADNDKDALYYVDGMGNRHPFTRNGWFMKSNYAKEQREGGQAAGPGTNAMSPTLPPTAGGFGAPLPQAAQPAPGGFGQPPAPPAFTPPAPPVIPPVVPPQAAPVAQPVPPVQAPPAQQYVAPVPPVPAAAQPVQPQGPPPGTPPATGW